MIKDKSATKENFASPLKSRYKVALCRNWVEGTCEFGNKCTFAHGEVELKRAASPLAVEKSTTCPSYKQKGYCINGTTCKFTHKLSANEKSAILELFSTSVAVYFVDLEDRRL